MQKLALSLLVATALFAVPAQAAETVTNKAARVTVSVPDGWKFKGEGEDLVVYDNANDVAADFDLVKTDDLNTAAKRLGTYLATKVDGLKWVKEEKVDVNGMKGVVLGGDGSLKGTNIDLIVLILDTPNPDKDLVVLAIAEDAKIAKHKNSINYLFNNIKPLKG